MGPSLLEHTFEYKQAAKKEFHGKWVYARSTAGNAAWSRAGGVSQTFMSGLSTCADCGRFPERIAVAAPEDRTHMTRAPTIVLVLVISCAAALYFFVNGDSDLAAMMLLIGASGTAGEAWRAIKRRRSEN